MISNISKYTSGIASFLKIRFIIITIIFSFVFSFSKNLFLSYKDTIDVANERIMGIIILLAVISEAIGMYLKPPFMSKRAKVELPLGMFIFRLFTSFFLLMLGMGLAFCDILGEPSNTALGAGFIIGVIWAFVSWFMIDIRREKIISDKHNFIEIFADVLLLIYSCVSMTFTWEFFMSSDWGKYIQHFEPDGGKIFIQLVVFLIFTIMYIAANFMHWMERLLIIRTKTDKFLILLILIITYIFAIK